MREVKQLENWTDETFFEPEFLKNTFENNKAYTKIIAKTFHNFCVIEIINEKEVKTHFTF